MVTRVFNTGVDEYEPKIGSEGNILGVVGVVGADEEVEDKEELVEGVEGKDKGDEIIVVGELEEGEGEGEEEWGLILRRRGSKTREVIIPAELKVE